MKTEVEKELTSDLDSWSGKTCRVRSHQTAAKTSARSSKKQSGSQTKMPQFLDLRMGGLAYIRLHHGKRILHCLACT